MRNAGGEDEVAGKLDIDRPFVTDGGVQHAVNFLEGGLRIAEHGRGDGELLEDLLLGVELADLVVQQGIFFAFLDSRRAADDDDRGFFGEGPGGGVGDLQAADAIGDADRAEAADAGIGVGGEPAPCSSQVLMTWTSLLLASWS